MLLNLGLLFALGSKGGGALRGMKKAISQRTFEEQIVVEGGSSSSKIVVIPLEGVIAFSEHGSLGDAMVDDFKNALEQAAEDDQIKAIVLQVDSPGGEVTASDVLYHAIGKLSKKKPVIVYFNSIGASGAFYAACGASWIMCNDTTFTGSIGVIISALNYRDLFGKVGLESVTFKSGKFKDMLNGARAMTPEESAYIQGLVMQSYDRFVGIVARARKLDEKALRTGVADGRILSGTDAFAAHLVDQLGYIEDAYAKARVLGDAPNAQVVRYKRNYSFDKFFRIFGESRSSKLELALPGQQVSLMPGRVYLLPAFFAPQ